MCYHGCSCSGVIILNIAVGGVMVAVVKLVLVIDIALFTTAATMAVLFRYYLWLVGSGCCIKAGMLGNMRTGLHDGLIIFAQLILVDISGPKRNI